MTLIANHYRIPHRVWSLWSVNQWLNLSEQIVATLGSFGRIAIQKLLYFLSVRDVPMRFRFRIYHYGPLCDDLAGTLDWLQADEIVCDDSTELRVFEIYIGTELAPEIKSRFQAELDVYQQTIRSVAHAMGSMDSPNAGIGGDLDFSFRWVHARGGRGPWKDDAIEKFKEIKRDKFGDVEDF